MLLLFKKYSNAFGETPETFWPMSPRNAQVANGNGWRHVSGMYPHHKRARRIMKGPCPQLFQWNWSFFVTDYGWTQGSTIDKPRYNQVNPLQPSSPCNFSKSLGKPSSLISGSHQSDDLLVDVKDSSCDGDGPNRCDGLEATVSSGIQPVVFKIE